jgi:hypothetical protein
LVITLPDAPPRAPNPSDQHPRLCRHRRLDDQQVKLALHIMSGEGWMGLVYVIVHCIELGGAPFGEGMRSLSVASEERAFGPPRELPPVWPDCIDLFQHDEVGAVSLAGLPISDWAGMPD